VSDAAFGSRRNFAILLVALLAVASTEPACAQTKKGQASAKSERAKPTVHKLAIQVDENDARVMNLALNNASNVVEYYKGKGEPVAIEIVTYGPGLHMLRADTSPVKSRVAEMSLRIPAITFVACANTQANMQKQEGKDVPIVSEARIMPSGVVRLMELQREGYAYIRP